MKTSKLRPKYVEKGKRIVEGTTVFQDQIPDYKRNNFNILRFFAAILVIVGHMYHLLGLPVLTLGGQAVSTIGVEIFFLISGYLITQSYIRDSNALRYGMRRIFRIIPGLAFLSILTAFVFGPLLTSLDSKAYFSNPNTMLYLKNILLYPVYCLPGVFENNIYPNAVNGSLWTLPVEVSMYIILPVVLYLGTKIGHKRVVLSSAAALVLICHLIVNGYHPNVRIIFYGTSLADALTLAPFFFVGALFSLPEIKKLLNIQLASVLMIGVMVVQVSYINTEILMLIALSYFVFSFALSQKPFFAKCFSKNDYSYGIYLYAFLIQQILTSKLKQYNLTFNTYLILSVVGSFFFAFLSWHLIEKPAQKLGKKIIKSIV